MLTDANDLVRCMRQIFDLCEKEDIPATFFEITTALAFSHFKESEVDAVSSPKRSAPTLRGL